MRVLAGAVGLALVVVYALGSGRWVAASSEWYVALDKPAWQPPPAVFGLAWAYNFTVLAVACLILAWRAEATYLWWFLGLFAGSVVLGIAWAYLFYVPHALLWSAVCLTLAEMLTVALVVTAWGQVVWLGVALLPYALWLAVATSLAWGYVALGSTTTG